MELYKRFPKLCLVWCSIEVALYAGQIFGWSALMYILKDEGFYANSCETFIATNSILDNKTNIVGYVALNTTLDNSKTAHMLANSDTIVMRTLENDSLSDDIGRETAYSYKVTEASVKEGEDDAIKTQQYTSIRGQYLKNCAVQDSRLNLWFSIGVGFSYVMCGFLGPLMRKIGMRFYRLFFLVVYVIGALCIGFSSPVVPWLLCPGLCCIGIAGMALYATNLQVSFLFIKIQSTITAALVGLFDVSTVTQQIAKVSFLFIKIQSTITAALVGLFDFSTVTQQIVKIAYAHNISRKGSFIFLAALHIVLVGISTFVLLPVVRYELSSSRTKPKTKDSNFNEETKEEREGFINEDEYKERTTEHTTVASPKLRELMLSSQYMLHLYWMAVMAIRFVSFIGFLNSWMTTMFVGNAVKETYYLSVFSYTTMGTAFTAITAGLLHDSQRWKYTDECDYRRMHLPIIVPLAVTILFSVLCTVLTFVRYEGFLYVTFILFTFFRSYVFSYEVTFINDAFPLVHFTQLFGILQLFAGVGSLLQYGLFEWFQTYDLAPVHVNIVLIVLEITTLSHPINIWYRSRKHECKQDSSKRTESTDIEIRT